uniref:PQL-like protein n=1 Tax=Habenaria pantlingiana TaxID=1498489 RepID=A0A0F7GWY9_9ASPA
MAMRLQNYSAKPSPRFATCHGRIPCEEDIHSSPLSFHPQFTRRTIAASMASAAVFSVSKTAFPFDFSLTVPDQTVEEAEAGIKNHARELLGIRKLIESESWKGVQMSMRESSSRLKQDLYTIIQAKPGSLRPELRKLYFNLFNNVTELDYAARSKDAVTVKERYNGIVSTLEEIFMKIQ